jgi:hypothetical protein
MLRRIGDHLTNRIAGLLPPHWQPLQSSAALADLERCSLP